MLGIYVDSCVVVNRKDDFFVTLSVCVCVCVCLCVCEGEGTKISRTDKSCEFSTKMWSFRCFSENALVQPHPKQPQHQ